MRSGPFENATRGAIRSSFPRKLREMPPRVVFSVCRAPAMDASAPQDVYMLQKLRPTRRTRRSPRPSSRWSIGTRARKQWSPRKGALPSAPRQDRIPAVSLNATAADALVVPADPHERVLLLGICWRQIRQVGLSLNFLIDSSALRLYRNCRQASRNSISMLNRNRRRNCSR